MITTTPTACRFTIEALVKGEWMKVGETNSKAESDKLVSGYEMMAEVRVTDAEEAKRKLKEAAWAEARAKEEARLDAVHKAVCDDPKVSARKLRMGDKMPSRLIEIDGVYVGIALDDVYSNTGWRTERTGRKKVTLSVNFDKAVSYPEKKDGTFNVEKLVDTMLARVDVVLAGRRREAENKKKATNARTEANVVAAAYGKRFEDYSHETELTKGVKLSFSDYGSMSLSFTGSMDADRVHAILKALTDAGLF